MSNGEWCIGLNPCCNGIYLIILNEAETNKKALEGLNPCCNGIYLIIYCQGANSYS